MNNYRFCFKAKFEFQQILQKIWKVRLSALSSPLKKKTCQKICGILQTLQMLGLGSCNSAQILHALKILQSDCTLFTCKSVSIQPRTSPDKFALWLGLASPDLGSFQSSYSPHSPCQWDSVANASRQTSSTCKRFTISGILSRVRRAADVFWSSFVKQ